MVLGDILLALILALLAGVVFSSVLHMRRGRSALIPVVFLFFLFAWAGGLWLRPVGPPVFGVYWVPGLFITVLVFLLLAIIMQGQTRTREQIKNKWRIRKR